MKEKISSSLEDYLEALLSLEDENKHIKMSDVALTVGVSKAGVHKAIQVLKERELVKQEKYKPLTLTDKGRKLAINVRNRHNIIKKFLVEFLEIDGEVAETEACKMEHGISQDTVNKLQIFMENIEK